MSPTKSARLRDRLTINPDEVPATPPPAPAPVPEPAADPTTPEPAAEAGAEDAAPPPRTAAVPRKRAARKPAEKPAQTAQEEPKPARKRAPRRPTEKPAEAPTDGEKTRPTVLTVSTPDAKRVGLYLHPDDFRALGIAKLDDGADANARIRAMIALWRHSDRYRAAVDRLARTSPRGPNR